MPALTVTALRELRERAARGIDLGHTCFRARITVHMGTCGAAAGARAIESAVAQELERAGRKDVLVTTSGCAGLCSREPMISVEVLGLPAVVYGGLDPAQARKIVAEHVGGERVVKECVLGIGSEGDYADLVTARAAGRLFPSDREEEALPLTGELPFFKKQVPLALRNRGLLDPESLEDAIGRGGYLALEKALTEMSPEAVIEAVGTSGLRGRGGAGFPTGMKWRLCRAVEKTPRYLIANCDEGDPGAFMDRSLLESDPHSILEGMAIAGYAIGAVKGYLYIRTEYPQAIARVGTAIARAEEHGLLGTGVLGTDFDFDVEIREGSGAFVCGEETALIHSIEGKSPEPRQRPPFPAQVGIWGCPTVINNVETLANVPVIINGSAEWYAGIGTERSKGTKIFSLVGKIRNTGLIEVPMGITLREIIYDIGEGIPGDKPFKAVQTGGPSGGCLPATHLDLPVDYDSLKEAGSIMGSGGLIVMDEDTCMVDVAKFFLGFTSEESCGKCTTCRDGSQALLEVLTRICSGQGRDGDIEFLEELSLVIRDASMCGLGKTLPNPVLSTLEHFRDEYERHITEGRCPALVCRDLLKFHIVPEDCVGCLLCLKACPTEAIRGALKEIHVIDQNKCTKCGSCFDVCPPRLSAIVKLSGQEARELKELADPVPVKEYRQQQAVPL